MTQRIVICILCIVLVSACDAVTNDGQSSSTNATTNDSYELTDLDNLSPTETGMVITGAINHNTGQVNAFSLPVDYDGLAYRNLEVETRNGYLLRFTYRTGIPEGTYPITTTLGTAPVDTEMSGGLLKLWSPDPAEQFTVDPEGTITITYQNNDIIASYTLAVQNPAGESVNIVGQLYAVESISASS